MPRLITGWIFPEVITEVSDGGHTVTEENDFCAGVPEPTDIRKNREYFEPPADVILQEVRALG